MVGICKPTLSISDPFFRGFFPAFRHLDIIQTGSNRLDRYRSILGRAIEHDDATITFREAETPVVVVTEMPGVDGVGESKGTGLIRLYDNGIVFRETDTGDITV
jgi:hypothetical protein